MFDSYDHIARLLPVELIQAAVNIIRDDEISEEGLKTDARAFLSCQFRHWTYAEEDDDQEAAE